jgi:hypothetical protein
MIGWRKMIKNRHGVTIERIVCGEGILEELLDYLNIDGYNQTRAVYKVLSALNLAKRDTTLNGSCCPMRQTITYQATSHLKDLIDRSGVKLK